MLRLSVAAACAAVSLLAPSATWIRVTTEPGFSVALPAEYERSSDTTMTTAGLVTQTNLTARHLDSTFRVGYTEFAGGVPAPAPLMLDATRDEWVRGVQGRLSRETVVEVQGHSGREWIVRVPRSRVLWARVVVTTRRIYTLTVETTSAQMSTPEMQEAGRAFFDSFMLVSP